MNRENENYRQTAKAWLVEQRRRIDNGEAINLATVPAPAGAPEGTAMPCSITVDLNTHFIVAHDQLPEVAVGDGHVVNATFEDGRVVRFDMGDSAPYDIAAAALAVVLHQHAEETRIGGNAFILGVLLERLGGPVDRDLIRSLAEAGVTAPRSILEGAA